LTDFEPVKLLIDEPLESNPAFNFEGIVDALRAVIAGSPPKSRLTVCISGAWGTGKSTVLRSLKGALETHGAPAGFPVAAIAEVEPWKLTTDEIYVAFVRAINQAVEPHLSFISRVTVRLEVPRAARLVADRILGVPLEEVNAVARLTAAHSGSFLEVADLFRRVAAAVTEQTEHPLRIVVLIDDLDRCSPKRVVETLETVKLFLDLPGCIFVFALDRDQIVRALCDQFPGMSEGHAETYLDKMFQLTYVLPSKKAADLSSFMEHQLNDLGIHLENSRLATAIVAGQDRNLRRIKLLLNQVAFQVALAKSVGTPIDTEALLKWLYLERTLPASLALAVGGGSTADESLDIVTALELVANGLGIALPANERDIYEAALVHDWTDAIIAALVTMLAGPDATKSVTLSRPDRQLVEALRADGSVETALAVLAEGASRLAHQDLPHLAYLTHSVDVTPRPEGTAGPIAEGKVEEGQKEGSVASSERASRAKMWDDLGDAMTAAVTHRAAYLAYLAAVRLDPTRGMYWADLASAARHLGRISASRAAVSRAIETDPSYAGAWAELANLVDITDGDRVRGNAAYRKILSMDAGTAATPSNYANNLVAMGDAEGAFWAYLASYVKGIGSDDAARHTRRLEHIRELAPRAGVHDLEFDDQSLRVALDAARAAGTYPPRFTDEDDVTIARLLASYPEVDGCSELLRLPS
jgi:tetratricopeptide (TPR) repeat protein